MHKKEAYPCFNTSYVSVQDYVLLLLSFFLLGFNTSYVSVQEWGFRKMDFLDIVSIHPMCRFKREATSLI